MSEKNAGFRYDVSGNEAVAIISFIGEMHFEAMELLEKCKDEIMGKYGVKVVVLDFKQVRYITSELVPTLAQMQKSIRSMQAQLRMCEMQTDLKDKLEKFGILRKAEMAPDLKGAIVSVKAILAKAA